MEIHFTLAEIISLCTALTALVGAYKVIQKPMKDKKEKEDSIEKTLGELKEWTKDSTKTMKFHSEMLYAMLSHMVTNNNTGQMQSLLDQYNRFFREN